jgi:hypothetical protein
MPISLQQITSVFSAVPFGGRMNLKEYYFDLFRKTGQKHGIDLSDETFYMKSYTDESVLRASKTAAKQIKAKMGPELTGDFSDYNHLLGCLLTEAALSLEKSIFWFLNYRASRRQGFLAPSTQASYYAELFGVVGLSRVLGLAITYVPLFNLVQTRVNWTTRTVELKLIGARKAGHLRHLYLLKAHIQRFSFIPQKIRGIVTAIRKFALTDDREELVYGFGNTARIYEEMASRHGDVCFLGGEGGLATPEPSPEMDPGDFGEAMMSMYMSYGYIEHTIGDLQKNLAIILKEVPHDGVKSFIVGLRGRIQRFQYVPEIEKRDLLDWLNF